MSVCQRINSPPPMVVFSCELESVEKAADNRSERGRATDAQFRSGEYTKCCLCMQNITMTAWSYAQLHWLLLSGNTSKHALKLHSASCCQVTGWWPLAAHKKHADPCSALQPTAPPLSTRQCRLPGAS